MPLTCYLCWSLHQRYSSCSLRSHFCRLGFRWRTLAVHVVMLLLFIWQTYSCYFLLQTYGLLAFFLSPVRTWALLMGLLLIYKVWRGPVPDITNKSNSQLWQWNWPVFQTQLYYSTHLCAKSFPLYFYTIITLWNCQCHNGRVEEIMYYLSKGMLDYLLYQWSWATSISVVYSEVFQQFRTESHELP